MSRQQSSSPCPQQPEPWESSVSTPFGTFVGATPAATQPSTTKRFEWTDAAMTAMLDVLLDSKRDGQGTGAGFKPSVWTEVADAIQKVTGHKLSKTQITNKWQQVKKNWRKFDQFQSAISGWTRTADGRYVSSPSVMTPFFARHPEWTIFSQEAFPFEEKLEELLQGNLATGKDAEGIDRILSSYDEEEVQTPVAPKKRKRGVPAAAAAATATAAATSSEQQTQTTPRSPTPFVFFPSRTPQQKKALDEDKYDRVARTIGNAIAESLKGPSVCEEATKLLVQDWRMLQPSEWRNLTYSQHEDRLVSALRILSLDEKEARAFLLVRTSGCNRLTRKRVFLKFLVQHGLLDEDEEILESIADRRVSGGVNL